MCFDSSDIGGRSLSSPNAEMHGIIPCTSWYYTMQQFMVLYFDYCKVLLYTQASLRGIISCFFLHVI